VTALVVVGASIGQSAAQAPAAQSGVAQQVTNFKSNPEQLLTTYPNGGVELTNRIREFALNDRTALDPIIALITKGNKDQKSAIGAGLAQAARIVFRTNRDYSEAIQRAVAETRDLDAFTAYAAAAGDTGTAATGAAGAGSAGASGGQTSSIGSGGSSGSLEAINGSSVNTGAFSFTSSVTGVGSSSSNGTTTTISSTTSP
jgi:hypothetical protein